MPKNKMQKQSWNFHKSHYLKTFMLLIVKYNKLKTEQKKSQKSSKSSASNVVRKLDFDEK